VQASRLHHDRGTALASLAQTEVSAMVRATTLAIGLAAVLVGVAAAEDKKTDKDRLQGEWKIVSVLAAGIEPEAKDQLVGMGLTFRGGKLSGGLHELEFKLDAAKDPREIDFTILKSPDEGEKGKEVPGVYKLEGDKLTVHFSYPGGPRPTDFECKVGTRTTLVVLERMKK
jgi:uncharacterized protein (TIGR03067 family)